MFRWLNLSLSFICLTGGLQAQDIQSVDGDGGASYLEGTDPGGYPNILAIIQSNPDGSLSLNRPSSLPERRSIGPSTVNDFYLWIGRVTELFTSDSHVDFIFYSSRGGSVSLQMARAEIEGEYLIVRLAELPSEEAYGNTGVFAIELSYEPGSQHLGYRFGAPLILSRFTPPITNVNNAMDSKSQGDASNSSAYETSQIPEIGTLGNSLAGGCGLISSKEDSNGQWIVICLGLFVVGLKLRSSKIRRSRLS